MSKFTKKIGVIGGMGSEASAKYYNDLIKICQKKYFAVQDRDYPAIIIYNLPLEDFDENGNFNPVTATKQLKEAAIGIEKAGADFIVIVCNTIHALYDKVQESVSIPVISLIKEVGDSVVKQNCKVVGLLTSDSTKNLKLYVNELAKHNIKSIETTKEEQLEMNNIVLKAMSGKNTHTETRQVKKIISRMVSDGAQAIILGCTEIPLVISQENTDVLVFDSTKILAEVALVKAL